MANDCLVTKLKGVVDNDNLYKIGEVRMMVKLSSSSAIPRTNSFLPTDSTPFEVTLLDDGVTFASATGDCQIIDSKHGIITGRYISDGNDLVVSGAEPNSWIRVSVKSKYNFDKLGIYTKDVYLSDMQYSTNLTLIRSESTCQKYGTFKDLSRMSLLNNLYIWDNDGNFTGNMSDLGYLTALTSLTLATRSSNKNHIAGSWEDFVTAQRNNGRSTCDSLDISNTYYCFIPFGNRSNIRVGGETEHGILKWDASKMSIQFDTSHKVLTIGYTAEQAASAFTGYEVIMCDPS